MNSLKKKNERKHVYPGLNSAACRTYKAGSKFPEDKIFRFAATIQVWQNTTLFGFIVASVKKGHFF